MSRIAQLNFERYDGGEDSGVLSNQRLTEGAEAAVHRSHTDQNKQTYAGEAHYTAVFILKAV